MSLHPDLSEHHGGLRLCLSPRVPIPGRGSPLSRYDVVVVFVVVVVSDELDFTCDFGLSDIDECLQTPNPCAYQCRNVPGSFRCQCPPGTVLLGDGRSCAGLEGRQPFGNRTRVRARLRPQLVSSLGRPILSRSTGASRITRQSCPAGYTQRDGTCVGESKSPRTAVLDVQHPRPAETKRFLEFFRQLFTFSLVAPWWFRCGRVRLQEVLSTRMQEHSGQLHVRVSSRISAPTRRPRL